MRRTETLLLRHLLKDLGAFLCPLHALVLTRKEVLVRLEEEERDRRVGVCLCWMRKKKITIEKVFFGGCALSLFFSACSL